MQGIAMWIRLQLGRLSRSDERGFVTAENLGVAALAVIALVAIFAALQLLGTDIIQYIRTQTIG
jgi:hypothetical protein